MTGVPVRAGLAVAAAGLAADQAAKAWFLGPYAIAEKGRVAVTPFLDLVLVWNRGVSYGLLEQGSDAGRWMLVGIGVAGALLFGYFLARADRLLPALSYGLIVGGAIGNVIDRIRFGAVADLFLLHAGRFEWYVFNLADTWIVAGVVGLVLSMFAGRREIATES